MTSIYQPVSQSQPSPIRSEVNDTFTYPALFDTKAEAAASVKTRPPQRVTLSVSINSPTWSFKKSVPLKPRLS